MFPLSFGVRIHLVCGMLSILILLPVVTLAQLDSLIQALETADPAQKPALFNRLCWDLRNEDSKQSLTYGLAAIEASEAVDDTYNLIKAYSFTGVAYRNGGYYKEALEYYTLGLEAALAHDDREQQCYGYINIANLFLLIKNPEVSLEQLERLEPLAVALDNPSILGYMHLNFGRVYLALGHNELALPHLQEALAIRQVAGNQHNQSVCKKYLGDVHYQLGDFKAAQRAYEEAITMMYFDNDHALLSAALNGFARALIESQAYGRAEELAQRSLEVAEGTSTLRAKEAAETLAQLAKLKGDFQQAENYLQTVLAYKDELFSENLGIQAERYRFQLLSAELRYKNDQQSEQFATDLKRLIGGNLVISITLFLLVLGSAWSILQRRRLTMQKRQVAFEQEKNEELEQRVQARTDELNEKNAAIQSLLEKEKQLLQAQLDHKERELGVQAMHAQEKLAIFSGLLADLKKLAASENLSDTKAYQRLEHKLTEALQTDRSDENFLRHFEGVHPDFFRSLQAQAELTANELKLCAYVKLGMNNKEVAHLFCIELGTVKSNINRLKKKLHLGPDDSFRNYILQVG